MLQVVTEGEPPPLRRRAGWARVSSRHRDVALIDLVAALVGEQGTDAPSGVHPTLVAVGQAVSDLSSVGGRRELRPLALAFPGTSHGGMSTPARLVDLCTSAALATTGELTAREVRRLEAARRLAQTLCDDRQGSFRGAARWWLPAARLGRLDEPLYRCFVAPAQVTAAVGIIARECGPERDLRLRMLLVQCLTEVSYGDPPQAAEYCIQFSDTWAPRTRHRDSGPVGM
jgi:hypothetical protein